MVFYPPPSLPPLPHVPEDTPVCDFIFDNRYRARPTHESRNPFTDALTGQSYSTPEVMRRVDVLARALARELGWHPNQSSEWDKTVGIYSANAVDYMTLCWAIHRCNGIPVPTSASYSASELSYPLRTAKVKALFTNASHLSVALEAAAAVGMPWSRIFLLEIPASPESPEAGDTHGFVTVNQLIAKGELLPPLEKLNWKHGQGKRQVAFLCSSSGTSGLPKLVKISHYNVIANTIQYRLSFAVNRKVNAAVSYWKGQGEVCLGLLPQCHIYSLVIICHCGVDVGDETIIMQRFNMNELCAATQKFKITVMYLVPPILLALLNNRATIDKNYNISCVHTIHCAAAPIGVDVIHAMRAWLPHMHILQGYGMTETATAVSISRIPDDLPGSSGNLVSGAEAKLLDPTSGREITEYDCAGELYVRSPSVTVLGYLANEEASAQTFSPDGWVRTGDEIVMRKSAQGTEHLFVVDRVKELIKTKGHQVAPAELEAHLLTHPFVADCAVVGLRDAFAGELPKAFVVKSPAAAGERDDRVAAAISTHVSSKLARHKALTGGVEFIDAVPKNPSGKIIRRLLRDKQNNEDRTYGMKKSRAKL